MYTTKYTDVLTARLVRISMCSVLYKKSIILTIIILLVVAVNNHNTIYLYIHTRVLIYIYICVLVRMSTCSVPTITSVASCDFVTPTSSCEEDYFIANVPALLKAHAVKDYCIVPGSRCRSRARPGRRATAQYLSPGPAGPRTNRLQPLRRSAEEVESRPRRGDRVAWPA